MIKCNNADPIPDQYAGCLHMKLNIYREKPNVYI